MRCKAVILCFAIWTAKTIAQRRRIEARHPLAQGADGLLSNTQQSNIDAVANAAKSLIDQAFPESTPSDVNLQTVRWPSSFAIGGTTYTGVPSTPTSMQATQSDSATQTSSISTETASSSVATSGTSTSATRTSSTLPSRTGSHEGAHEESNTGDRKVAIALGILFILAAVTLVAVIFFALWRRKRQTGSYFKNPSCSECVITPPTSVNFGAGTASPWTNDRAEPSRSGFNGARSGITGSGRSARSNSIRANFPEMTRSAERLPIPIDQTESHDGFQEVTPAVHIPQFRGHTRLRKSYSSMMTDEPESTGRSESTQPLELSGDDLAVITEMDAESPTRTTASLRRLSSFPFVLPSGLSAYNSAEDDCNGWLSRSSSRTRDVSELDAQSPRMKPDGISLTRLSINPIIMAQLAEAEADYHNSGLVADISRSNSDNTCPAEMDGESPTRRASTWRELQRSSFTAGGLTAEIAGFNKSCEMLERSDSETSSLASDRDGADRKALSPTSTTAWTELPGSSERDITMSSTVLNSSSGGSLTDGDTSDGEARVVGEEEEEEEEEGPRRFTFTDRGASSEIRTTELILPPRVPQPTSSREATSSVSPLSSSHTAEFSRLLPVDDRDSVFSRARLRGSNNAQAEISPLPTPSTHSGPAWAPAGAYMTAPIWRKKRPAPLSPDFLHPSSGSTVSSDSRTSPARERPGGSLEASSNDPHRRKPRPRPLTPDWLPESLRAGRSAVNIADDDEDEGLEAGDDNGHGGFNSKADGYLAREPLPSAMDSRML